MPEKAQLMLVVLGYSCAHRDAGSGLALNASEYKQYQDLNGELHSE